MSQRSENSSELYFKANFKKRGPCKECPFRKDRNAYLTKGIVKVVYEALTERNFPFPCHKHRGLKERSVCPGAVIFLLNIGKRPEFMKNIQREDFSEVIPIFDSVEAILNHHENGTHSLPENYVC